MSSDVYIRIGTNVQSLVHVLRSRELCLRCVFFFFFLGGMIVQRFALTCCGSLFGETSSRGTRPEGMDNRGADLF